jgi:HEAT repeat protein
VINVTTIEQILKSKNKPKEKVDLLAKEVKENRISIDQLIDYFEIGSVAEKGSCIEAMEHVSRDKPEIVLLHIDFIIAHINDEAPKVKWETAEAIANISQKYPNEVINAIPKLFLNAKDSGTVVRWSAAFALTEIAKNNPKTRKELVPKFKEIAEKEKNNGVKNVYVKALKIVETDSRK